MITLKVKQKKEQELRLAYPWAAKEDFEKVPENQISQEIVEVTDAKGNFISRGYINKNSYIFYRALSFDSREQLQLSNVIEFLLNKIIENWRIRKISGYQNSFRLVFSENDGLPGIIIDRFVIDQKNKKCQVLSVQILTLGMNQFISDPFTFFKKLIEKSIENGLSEYVWEETHVILRNDAKVREKEGLVVSAPLEIKKIESVSLNKVNIVLDHFYLKTEYIMTCNLLSGQKTGFFLDQNYNLLRTAEVFFPRYDSQIHEKQIKMLDICCFLGHWSLYFGLIAKKLNIQFVSNLIDISDEALSFSSENLNRYSIDFKVFKKDVLEDPFDFEKESFDLVIVDPPAFVKNKNHLQAGKHAYQKLNSKSIFYVKKWGIMVSCSCSGSVSIDDFRESLQKAFTKSFRKNKCLGQAGHAPDHPFLMSFKEGIYLKMFMHIIY